MAKYDRRCCYVACWLGRILSYLTIHVSYNTNCFVNCIITYNMYCKYVLVLSHRPYGVGKKRIELNSRKPQPTPSLFPVITIVEHN